MTITEPYSIAELSARRRIAQSNLRHETIVMRLFQTAYDRIKRKYHNAVQEYQKIDLEYANRTKLSIMPKKTKSNNPRKVKAKTKKSKYDLLPAKTRKLLSQLNQEELQKIINELENKKRNK